ncbi:hypothetical protein DFH28DRAFT_1145274 [Melampsora americana]|nr:hypothetical protein DFH28DRAFT_1145274 [Melampsora americana]
MSLTLKVSFVVLVLGHFSRFARACEGACITDTTKAFIGNYSLYHINPVFDSLADMIHSKILSDRPISDVHALIAPINSHWHNTIYDQTEKAIFPGYFHGKCQRVIDGVYKNPVGCPNPDCPVVCGTPGSMVHFYDKLVSIVFEVMQKSLHTSLPTSGTAFERLEQAVLSLATSSSHRRSSLYARAFNNKPKAVSTLPIQFLDPISEQGSSSGQKPRSVESGENQDNLPLGLSKGLGGNERSLPLGGVLSSVSQPTASLLGRRGLPVDPTELASSVLEGLPVDPSTLLGGRSLPVDPTTLASGLLDGLPINPTTLLGGRSLPVDPTTLASSLLEGLPVNPSTLLGGRSLPVDPTELASSVLEGLPVNPSTLLGGRSLPVDPTTLASGLLDGLPINPTTLLGGRSLPVDPTTLASSLLEGLPVNPSTLLGGRSLPVDPSTLASGLLEGLPVNPTTLLGERSLPVDPTTLASGLLEGLPINPTTLLGGRSLPVDPTTLASGLLKGLPVNPSTLIGERSLPVDPSTLASGLLEGLPVNPTTLLSERSLPVDPTTLASSLLEGLPIKPTTLLGERSLPVDPSSLLSTLPVKPEDVIEKNEMPKPLQSYTGSKKLPMDVKKVVPIPSLPVLSNRSNRRRSLPIDPETLEKLTQITNEKNPLPLGRKPAGLPIDTAKDVDAKKILSKVDDLKHQDLTQLPSSRLVKDVTQRESALPLDTLPEKVKSAVKKLPLTRRSRFRRVLRSGLFDDEEKQAKGDSPATTEDKEEGASNSEEKDNGSATTEDQENSPVSEIDDKPEDEQTNGEDEPMIAASNNSSDADPTRRLAKREPQLELPQIADANLGMIVGSPLSILSKRRLSHISDQEISISLKKIIEECNRKFKEGCGSNLEKCRWDKSMKEFILSFP